jgi:hypothetical protein
MMRLLVCMVVIPLLAASCAIRQTSKPAPSGGETPSGPVFDPLATPADREVVPDIYPLHAGAKPQPPAASQPSAADSVATAAVPLEVFRVQIFTTRLYAEAARERALASEIFNLPVYLDYEVPYYKLRVGDFPAREEAEGILREVQTIGYPNPWVARVMRRVQEMPADDEAGEPILPELKPDTSQVPGDTIKPQGTGDGR